MKFFCISCLLLLLLICGSVQAGEGYVFTWHWGGYGPENWHFMEISGIAADSAGNVYVADRLISRIQKFNSTGGFITKWGSPGSGDGQFRVPGSIAVDSTDNVYVVDSGNHRIQKFTSNGTFITKWGSHGSGDGQFNATGSVAVDNAGNVYVSDPYEHWIQKFTTDGTFITKWGTQGSGDGELNSPRGIAADTSGYVYVVDAYNRRIQKFTSNGTFITKWGSQGSGDGQFGGEDGVPERIAVDNSGNVYVPDTILNRIQKFTTDGTFVTKWGNQGSGDGRFGGVEWRTRGFLDVAVDSNGTVYVADNGNYWIHAFKPGEGPTVTPSLQQVPGTVQAEDYDAGGEGVGYHDTTPGNTGGQYRQDDVDIEQMAGGGYDLCYIRDGEWVNYTVQVATAGDYTAIFRAASWGEGHTIALSVDRTPAGTAVLANTGSPEVYVDTALSVSLPAGTHTLTLRFTGDGENLDSVTFTGVTTPTPTLQPVPPSTLLPTDPNHDGLYEDLNGNRVADFNDVVLFFNQMDWIPDHEPVAAFDFNLNGQIDFNDIVRVFSLL